MSIYPTPRGFPSVSVVKNLPAYVGDMVQEGPLEKEMPTHSSILTWETPWTEEPGGATVHWVKELGKASRLSPRSMTPYLPHSLYVL